MGREADLSTTASPPVEMTPTGRGRLQGRASWKRTRRNAWGWRAVLSLAFGQLGLPPEHFWRMTLAEWRVAVEGYAAKTTQRRREQAWVVSHLLIAAGCKPEQVTPAKLLGEKEPRRRRRDYIDEETRKAHERKKIIERIRKDREKRGVTQSASYCYHSCISSYNECSLVLSFLGERLRTAVEYGVLGYAVDIRRGLCSD